MNLNSQRHYEVNAEELDVLEKISEDFGNYKKRVDDMKGLKISSNSKDLTHIHMTLREFNLQHLKIEEILDGLVCKNDFYKKLREYTQNNRNTHKDMVNIYFQTF